MIIVEVVMYHILILSDGLRSVKQPLVYCRWSAVSDEYKKLHQMKVPLIHPFHPIIQKWELLENLYYIRCNPLSGEVFIFLGKNRRCIKILYWEKDGFLLYHKKLEKGTYEAPQ